LVPGIVQIDREQATDQPLKVYFYLGGTAVLGTIDQDPTSGSYSPVDTDYYVSDNVSAETQYGIANVYSAVIPAGQTTTWIQLKPVVYDANDSDKTIAMSLVGEPPAANVIGYDLSSPPAGDGDGAVVNKLSVSFRQRSIDKGFLLSFVNTLESIGDPNSQAWNDVVFDFKTNYLSQYCTDEGDDYISQLAANENDVNVKAVLQSCIRELGQGPLHLTGDRLTIDMAVINRIAVFRPQTKWTLQINAGPSGPWNENQNRSVKLQVDNGQQVRGAGTGALSIDLAPNAQNQINVVLLPNSSGKYFVTVYAVPDGSTLDELSGTYVFEVGRF